MLSQSNTEEMLSAIKEIDFFLRKELIPRITSAPVFEIMNDCPELLRAIEKLQSCCALLPRDQRKYVEELVTLLEQEINKLLGVFKSVLDRRSKESEKFSESIALQQINAQHEALVQAFQTGVERLIKNLDENNAVPSLEVNFGLFSFDLFKWWEWFRNR